MSLKKIAATAVASTASLLPLVALAQTPSLNRGITGLLLTFNNALNMLMGILITAAVVALFYQIAVYFFKEGAEAKAEALQFIFWGVVAIFVMVSIWGLVVLLQYTFGVNGKVNVTFPTGAPVQGTATF